MILSGYRQIAPLPEPCCPHYSGSSLDCGSAGVADVQLLPGDARGLIAFTGRFLAVVTPRPGFVLRLCLMRAATPPSVTAPVNSGLRASTHNPGRVRGLRT